MTVVDAIEHVKKHRCILPNRGFSKTAVRPGCSATSAKAQDKNGESGQRILRLASHGAQVCAELN